MICHLDKRVTCEMAVMPWSGLSCPAGHQGLLLSAPPDTPCHRPLLPCCPLKQGAFMHLLDFSGDISSKSGVVGVWCRFRYQLCCPMRKGLLLRGREGLARWRIGRVQGKFMGRRPASYAGMGTQLLLHSHLCKPASFAHLCFLLPRNLDCSLPWCPPGSTCTALKGWDLL